MRNDDHTAAHDARRHGVFLPRTLIELVFSFCFCADEVETGLEESSSVDALHLCGQNDTLQLLATLEHWHRHRTKIPAQLFKTCEDRKAIKLPAEVEFVDAAAF